MRNMIALAVAVVLAIVAAAGITNYLKSTEQQHKERYDPVPVVSAKQRIKAGSTIEMKMLEDAGRRVSRDSLTADHIHDREKYVLIGQVINRDVERGEPLLRSYFSRPVVRLENKLRAGERAISIDVDAVTGVAGNIVPGSHVDILGNFPATAAAGKTPSATARAGQTVLLLPNVTVLAVDDRTRDASYSPAESARRGAYRTVTFAVTPEEAQLLVFAQNYGQLALALRSTSDASVDTPAPVTPEAFLPRASDALRARAERLQNLPGYTLPAAAATEP